MSKPTAFVGYPGYYKGYKKAYNRFGAGANGYPNGEAVPSGFAAVRTGTADITAPALYGIGAGLDGENLSITTRGVTHVLVFNGATNTATEAAMLAALNTLWAGLLNFSQGGPAGNKLVIRTLGRPVNPPVSIIVNASTSLVNLGLTAATTTAPAATAKAAMVGGRPVLETSSP